MNIIRQVDFAEIDHLAKVIWEYHHMYQVLQKSDCILVLGSSDLRVAEYSADLWKQKWAPLIMFSGGLGHRRSVKRPGWETQAEADKFAKIAVSRGVPRRKILIENKSSNTGENIRFSYEIIKGINPKVTNLILVQKPYMERRAYATFMKQWPLGEMKIIVTSPPISFEEYPNKLFSKENLIDNLIGTLDKIIHYPSKGFQIYQEVPPDVLHAYEILVKLGFTKFIER